VEERIIRLRKELSKHGLDAGTQTIRVHLQRSLGRRPDCRSGGFSVP
jgi:hypothetical protein